MKAVILAGGEGTRLRPLSCGTPKPMTKLFDRPVMEHTLNLLKKCDINDIAVTLCYMPQVFEEYFGNGNEFGVNLYYYYENTPLGTAGSVAQCRDFLNDDFLVISGDSVCDFDFNSVYEFHKNSGAEVTVIMSHQNNPLAYGLVLCDKNGRVERFIEKPSWDRVFTDTANTGIYILSPSVFNDIPSGVSFDFAQNLFPKLLGEGRPVYATAPSGYWCDIGNCGAYLGCVRDILSGKAQIDLPNAERGIRALSPIPQGVTVSTPVYIGKNVIIGEGAHIGPYTVLGEGTKVGVNARVIGSVSNGGYIGKGARLRDSIICKGSHIGDGAVLNEGSVIGENAGIGENANIRAGILVWPDKTCEDGADVRFNITSQAAREPHGFGDNSTISGEPDNMLTPEFCTSIGIAAAMACGDKARIGIGCENIPACGMLASALECGIRSGGAKAVRCGGGFAASAAFASRYASLNLCFFVFQENDHIVISVFDSDGLPPDRAIIRRIENIIKQGDYVRAPIEKTGRIMKITGLMEAYCNSATSYGDACGKAYSVRSSTASDALCNILWLMGARIAPRGGNRALFSPSPDGLELCIIDENGSQLDNERTMALAAYAALDSGLELAVPFSAPAVLETIAEGFNKKLYRISGGADDERRLWADQLFMRDGVHRAAYLAAYTAVRDITIAELAEKTPVFHMERREIPLTSDRARFMRIISDSFSGTNTEYGRGMRVQMDGGYIYIAPSSRASMIKICAESNAAELARELCDGISERIKQIDSNIKRRKIN